MEASVGRKLFLSVVGVFVLFAVSFIIFQQSRERQYKIDALQQHLQDYNIRVHDALHYLKDSNMVNSLRSFNKIYKSRDMRLTVIDKSGRVIYDNVRNDFNEMANHSNRPEIKQAKAYGTGYSVERKSQSVQRDYFYSATYFPDNEIFIRSSLPYNTELSVLLKTDQHYIWFALITFFILVVVLYRFMHRLDKNIRKLKIFATRADHNENIITEDLIDFSNDELGEIAERIIKMYKRLQDTRQEQDVLKRQLTQNIAHELKTPVAGIRGYLETILQNAHIDDATKEQFLQRCYAQSKRLTSLLNDISTLNKMDDGAKMQILTDVDISTMVSGIVKETALQMESRDMVFDDRIPDKIIINGNQSLIYSIFRNLTDNAIAYAGDGTTITLMAIEERECWKFSFSDNGIGVAPEHLSRLFERFYRVDKGRSRNMGGTGLGLAIVKNAVILHGGFITVKNNEDGGLLFEFALSKRLQSAFM